MPPPCLARRGPRVTPFGRTSEHAAHGQQSRGLEDVASEPHVRCWPVYNRIDRWHTETTGSDHRRCGTTGRPEIKPSPAGYSASTVSSDPPYPDIGESGAACHSLAIHNARCPFRGCRHRRFCRRHSYAVVPPVCCGKRAMTFRVCHRPPALLARTPPIPQLQALKTSGHRPYRHSTFTDAPVKQGWSASFQRAAGHRANTYARPRNGGTLPSQRINRAHDLGDVGAPRDLLPNPATARARQ